MADKTPPNATQSQQSSEQLHDDFFTLQAALNADEEELQAIRCELKKLETVLTHK